MTTLPYLLGPEFDDFVDDPVVGSSTHQDAIVVLFQGLDGYAAQHGLPWFVGNRLPHIFSDTAEGTTHEIVPDISVSPTLTAAPRDSLVVAEVGPPALIIEVADPVVQSEPDLTAAVPAGKFHRYTAAEIPEYICFDPQADVVSNQVWACRLGSSGYEPWLPEADGRWHSTSLGIAFAIQGSHLRVYDHHGRRVPAYRELREENAALHARIAALEAEIRREQR